MQNWFGSSWIGKSNIFKLYFPPRRGAFTGFLGSLILTSVSSTSAILPAETDARGIAIKIIEIIKKAETACVEYCKMPAYSQFEDFPKKSDGRQAKQSQLS